jgi:cell division protein FtsN
MDMKKNLMKYLLYFLISVVLFSSSCAGLNKRLRKSRNPVSEQKTAPDNETTIKEVEEKLVANEDGISNLHHYFVIIGSFRNPENSKKFQEQILKEGFNSEILKNEYGLYRVSVMATNDINIARCDIRRIRSSYPKYYDIWLLMQKK